MDNSVNIIVMGPRASGKTTISRLLADGLQRPFVDLDVRALARFSGCAGVADVWRRFGEARWREAEAAALAEVLRHSGQIVALGGGTPMISSARATLLAARDAGTAVLVYLDCEAAVLRERLRRDHADRPPLHGTNAIDEVDDVLRERRPVYLQLAGIVVDSGASAEAATEEIIARMHKKRPSPSPRNQ